MIRKAIPILLCFVFLATGFIACVIADLPNVADATRSAKYDTLQEAFEMTALEDIEFLGAIEDDGIALVNYRRRDATVASSLFCNSGDGWEKSLNDVINLVSISNSGFIDIYRVSNKYAVVVMLVEEETVPSIRDSLGSKFLTKTYMTYLQRTCLSGLLVSETPFPSDYTIYINDVPIGPINKPFMVFEGQSSKTGKTGDGSLS